MTPTAHPEDTATELARLRKELADAREQVKATEAAVEHSIARANHVAITAELGAIELTQLVNVTPDALWVVDQNFTVRRGNDPLLRLLGKTRDQVVGRKCFDVFNYGLCHTPGCPITRLSASEKETRLQLDVTSPQLGETGMVFIANTSRFLGLDGEMLGVVTSFKDITERQHAQADLQARNRNLEALVALDVLTQLANRRHFDEVLHVEWLRAAREKTALSVIMCNVDNFQRYNDHHGQAAGDDVIKQVAAAIRGQARRPADVVARYSDSDFGVILPGTPVEGAIHVAERIRTAVEKMAIAHNGNGLVTLSLGVAGDRPAHATVPATLVQDAAKALAAAKQDGRNRSRVAGSDKSST